MSYYHACEYCGANLDPGERCDCIESVYRKYHKHNKSLKQFTEEIRNEGNNSKAKNYCCSTSY